ncbi:hypothetical protein ADL00_23080 [Streptomyces sp. AS58]|uniref:hypothetical protein n=1 Tax=Streptomyces TaxID=1883 RepID=UPI0006C500B3|nr:hypothetical protein [Streptomyces sp. AS58]KOV63818.1 hypothetical protein ADL00_23080 [Streptomyces sp. AS58]
MGEGRDEGGATGRRRTHPHGAAPGPGDDGVAALLGAALRDGEVDSRAQQRAVAAFRAARDAGAHGARTRRRDDWRRDDWRPRWRPASWSARTTLSVLMASLTLGGVGFAAIGSPGSPAAPDRSSDRPSHRPAPSAPASPAPAPSRAGDGTRDRPDPAEDTEAHCRAYERVAGRGRALEATAWQRLIESAGGAPHVQAYCAEVLAKAPAKGEARSSGKPSGRGESGGHGEGAPGRAKGRGQ